MSDEFRIARLEYVLGCLLSYLHGYLGTRDAEELLLKLRNENPLDVPAYLRRIRHEDAEATPHESGTHGDVS